MSQDLAKAIYYELSTDTDLSALVGTRIYPAGEAPADVDYPYMTFQRIDQQREGHQGGTANLLTARWQFDAWAETADDAEEVGDAVAALLDMTRGTWGTGSYATVVRLSSIETDSIEWEAPSDASQARPHRVSVDAILVYRE